MTGIIGTVIGSSEKKASGVPRYDPDFHQKTQDMGVWKEVKRLSWGMMTMTAGK